MHAGSGFSVPPPPPHGMVPLDSLQISMISISIPCYGAPSDMISSERVLEKGLLAQVDGFLMGQPYSREYPS